MGVRERPRRHGLIGALAIAGIGLMALPAGAAKDDLDLVSRATGGAAANGNSFTASISGDGRRVAFVTRADNISAEDDNTWDNVFVRDLTDGTTTFVSRVTGAAGAGGDGNSEDPSISADGRYVAFASNADNLSAEDDDGVRDVFVRDLQTGTTTLVSRATGPGGPGGDGLSRRPSISSDGRYVAFESAADNLSTEDDPGFADIYVRDLVANTTTLVSRATGPGGVGGNGTSERPSISADGRYVAFASNADNLSDEDDDTVLNVYVRDLQDSTTTLISRQSAADGGAAADASSGAPAISADGRRVAFHSIAGNLSAEDDDASWDVFVRDLQGSTTTLVSRAAGATGAGGDADSREAAVSADGRYVAFESAADNLSTEDDDTVQDVFVRDVQDSTTTLVSRGAGAGGAGGDGGSVRAAISSSGRYVAFDSNADNLSPDDDNAFFNVFRRDVLGAPPTPGGAVCATVPAPAPGTPGTVRLTVGQMRINQRIYAAGIRRAAAVEGWLSAGVVTGDLCAGGLSDASLGPGITTGPGPGGPITGAAPTPRPITPRPPTDKGEVRFELSTRQLRINQRIAQALVRRANGLRDRMNAGLTGGDLADGQVTTDRLSPRVRVTAAAAVASPPGPTSTTVAPPRAKTGVVFEVSARQLRINQRIGSAAIRRLNAVRDRLLTGLADDDFRADSITAVDLAPGVAP